MSMLERFKEAADWETRRGWSVPSSRTGRRPISIDRLLAKERDGSLGGHSLHGTQRVPSTDDEMPENLQRAQNTAGTLVVPSVRVASAGMLGRALAAKKASVLGAVGSAAGRIGGAVRNTTNRGLDLLQKHENAVEVGGLGYLASPNIDNAQAEWRARRAGLGDPQDNDHVSRQELDRFRLIPEKYHDAVEATGLGSLAAPLVAKRLRTGSWH